MEAIMKVKSLMFVGVALILLGILALSYQGITYTTREKVLEVGPLQATAEKGENDSATTDLERIGTCRRIRIYGAVGALKSKS
jgi:hypothetical protein